MKNNNKTILPARITCLLLTFSLIFSIAYTSIIYLNERNNLITTAQLDYKHAYEIMDNQVNIGETFYILLNDLTGENSTIFTNDYKNTHIIITDKKHNITSETGKCYVNKIYFQGSASQEAYIKFDNFKNALTDEQYKNMVQYLTTGNYYIVCTRFMLSTTLDRMLIPLELSLINLNGSIEKIYKTSNQEHITAYNNKNLSVNIIPTDFILNKQNNDAINNLDDIEFKNSIGKLNSFSFVYYNKQDFMFSSDSMNNINIQPVYSFEYTRKYNILDGCFYKIVAGDIIILLFFILIWIMLWIIFKKNYEEECKRRNFTNTMAHNLKTPLFVICGYSENLIENIQTQKRLHYAQSIRNQSEIMKNLIHQMLEFSNIDAGDFPVNKEEFDLCELTENILADYKDFDTKISFEATASNKIFADKELIKTALKNLIDNAVKYSTDDIKIEIEDNTFSISNPSNSINKTQLKQIWQPYFRVESSNNKEGNGLGLSIVKSILDAHNAKYSATYSNGLFTIVFKL